jgi:hypothetical protein
MGAASPPPKPEPSAEASAAGDQAAGDQAAGDKAAARAAPRTAKSAPTESPSAALSPEAARDLDDAEAALAAGKPVEALRLAQHSLYAQASSRAYAVITRARCAEGDLGNAKAALSHVSARDRSQVVRACAKLNVELR